MISNQLCVSENFKETRAMYTISDNIDIMTGNETSEINEELFKSF